MLPVTEGWYRRLLLGALLLGGAGAVFALAYSGVTEAGMDLIFGEVSQDPWSGEWWWIPLVAGGALVVAVLRRYGGVADEVPGTIAYARKAWVEPSSAFALATISAVSLIAGASLGPSFGVTIAGGGLGSWLATRWAGGDSEGRQEFALTGMSGSFGALFSAPVFAGVMVTELSPTTKQKYVTAFVPELIAATVGYAIFFGISGKVMLEAFEMDGYEYEAIHLLFGVILGVLAVVTLVAFALVGKAVKRVMAVVEHPYARALIGGSAVGLIAFALPLTVTSGSNELAYETEHVSDLAIGLLIAVLIVKMIAVVLSQEAGFLGGVVFPMLFVGGTAGILVHAIFPDIPAPLAVTAMVAAVPGAIISAPVSFILLGVGTVGLGVAGMAPVGIAVIIAHLTVSAGKAFFADAHDSI